MGPIGPENFYGYAMRVRAGASGVAEEFGIQFNGSTTLVYVNTLSSSLAFNTSLKNKTPATMGLSGPVWFLRIRDDGTNRYFEVSNDCALWQTFYSEARATYGTMDRGGWQMTASSSYPLAARLIHYREY
jgi:hypothetical protein